jgi:hypothetical protein
VERVETGTHILLRGLVEDAGLFAPTPLSMRQAVERHRTDRIVAHPMLAHRFLCPADRWPELLARLPDGEHIEAGAVLGAGRRAAPPPEPHPRVAVAHYEARARPGDLRMAADLYRSGEIDGRGRTVYFAFDDPADLREAVAVLAGARPLGVALRCGGPDPADTPGVGDLGDAITACVARDVPFRAVGGLPHAAGYTDPRTGSTHCGYLNLLMAAVAAVAGDRAGVRAALTADDGARLAERAAAVEPAAAARAREVFVGYAATSTGDPVRDAERFGLLGSWEI